MPEIPAIPPVDAEFPILGRWDFFNHAGVAPIPARARRALEKYAQQAAEDAYMTGKWYRQAEQVRQLAAKLINASHHEIAFAKNTSEGLAFVANGLTWNAGDEIIGTEIEYPSNVYPWMDLAQRFGARHIMLPEKEGRIPTEDVLAAITPRTRMVALSHVEYGSGYRNDLAAIGKVCRERGILLCVDAIQSCGAVPVDVQAMNIDFLSADGHKWLLGPEGLGIFYCRKELIAQVRPEIGWMNVINATAYEDFDFTLRADARRFECGSYNLAGILAMGASLELFFEVGLNLVHRRILALTDHLAGKLTEKGYRVFSPRTPDAAGHDPRSGIVSFDAPNRADHDKIVRTLEAQKIIVVQRIGRLRASPHFYNTPEQLDRLVAALP